MKMPKQKIRRKFKHYIRCSILSCLLIISSTAFAQNDAPDFSYNQDYANNEDIRVQIVTDQETEIISRISGRINHISFKDGRTFNKDDVLIEFDCKELNAKLKKAKAREALQKEKHNSTADLFELGGASNMEVNIAKAEMQEAQAILELSKIQQSHCVLKAPFSGIVSRLDVKDFQFIPENTPLMLITNNNDLVLEMLAPSKWLNNIKENDLFSFKVDDIEKTFQAQIIRIGGRFDPVTQTVKLYGKLIKHDPKLRVGMTGSASFDFVKK